LILPWFYEALVELARYSDLFDRHMGLSGPNSSYAQVNAIISSLKANDQSSNEYIKRRALFEIALNHYKAMKMKRSGDDNNAGRQEDGPVYSAGLQLLEDTDKTAKAVDREGRGHLATILKYATENLQDLIGQQVHSGAVLQSQPVVAMPEKCSRKEYEEAKLKLESGKHDKFVFSATRFLEAVATAVVDGFLFAATAIANSAPSLLSSVPPATAPRFDMPSAPSPATRRKEKMSGTLGVFFTEVRKFLKNGSGAQMAILAPPNRAAIARDQSSTGRNGSQTTVSGVKTKVENALKETTPYSNSVRVR
jgi:hypothetical protein